MVSIYRKVVDNLFADPKIRPVRFRNFCRFALNAMKTANTDGKYDAFIKQIQAVIDALSKEMNSIDSGVTNQKNNTSEVDLLIYNFGQFMKTVAGAIAYALGGEDTPAYLEFYPYKKEEYLAANKTVMPNLTVRVFNAATKYADKLGTQLTADLQAFSAGYDAALEKQETQMANVSADRKQRNSAFVDGQWVMTGIVHAVASLNNRNPNATLDLFPFKMLYAQAKPFILKAAGKLAVGKGAEIANRTMTGRVKVAVANTSVNADVAMWLAMSPAAEMPATAVIIKANSQAEMGIEKLGNVQGTFLMVQNLSTANEAAYDIEIRGLKKTKEEKAATKETMAVVAEEPLAS